MNHKSPILIIHERDDGRTARRFVAALCFMEFYVLFVYYGHAIWNTNGGSWPGFGTADQFNEWVRVALFASTPLLYLCGRGLLRSGERHGRWLWLGIVGLLAICLMEGIAAAIASVVFNQGFGAFFPKFQSIIPDEIFDGVHAAFFHLPLWATLVTLSIVTRTRRTRRPSDRSPWVYCAAVYCFTLMAAAAFNQSHIGGEFGHAMGSVSTFPGIQYSFHVIVALLLLATGVLLIRGSRLARSIALIIAAMSAVAIWMSWFHVAWLINNSVETLLNTVRFSTPVERPYTWTQHDFVWLFVLPAHYLLPWILIALYAWRVPMRKPTDDGTPFPRRLCGRCRYNLFGCEAEICPECGSRLSAD